MDHARLSTALANIELLESVTAEIEEGQRVEVLEALRNDIRTLNDFRLYHGSDSLLVQTRSLSFIQSIAFRGFSCSAVTDVTTWCLERWLRLVSIHPHSVDVLRGKCEASHGQGQVVDIPYA
jgi:hypothetical protein